MENNSQICPCNVQTGFNVHLAYKMPVLVMKLLSNYKYYLVRLERSFIVKILKVAYKCSLYKKTHKKLLKFYDQFIASIIICHQPVTKSQWHAGI